MSERVAVSANEFCVTVAKACVAAGVERSNAKDIALACCLLEERGTASLPPLDVALERADAPTAQWDVDGHSISTSRIDVLHEGCAALDLTGAFADVRFACDDLVLMQGLAMLRGVDLTVDNHRRLTLSARGPTVLPRGPIAFRDAAWWRRFEQRAAGLLVPTTAATRADAGAGNTDND